jgi:hypothetical protein
MTAKKKKAAARKAAPKAAPKAAAKAAAPLNMILRLPGDLVVEVDAWRFERGLEGEPVARSVAIRALIRSGLRG